MADPELSPWEEAAKKPRAEDKPKDIMPWEEAAKASPGVGEDIVKTTGPSLLRGSLMAITTPRAISDLTGAGVNYLANKLPEPIPTQANKFHNWDSGIGKAFPSYEETKGDIEKEITGPLYEAKTGIGKGVQTGLEVAPSLLTGGESLPAVAGRAIGSGTLSGLMGSGLDYLKEKFPSIPDWVPKVGRATGALVGGAVAPRVVTPLPMSNEQHALTTSLEAVNPELKAASSAGQWTGSPRTTALEARSPRMAGVPDAQAEAYTQGVMRQAGAPGHLFDAAGKGQASARGAELDALRNAHTVSPTEMDLLNRQNRQGYVGLSDVVGGEAAKPYLKIQEDIRLGPKRGAPGFPTNLGNPLHPTDMPGQRVGALAQEAQAAGTGATPTLVGDRLFDMRTRLNNALYNSMPTAEAERLRNLNKQYSNWKTIEGIKTNAGQNTVSPDQVFGKAPVGSELETHATQASQVMKPHPKPSNEMPPAADLLISLLSGAAQGGAGAAVTHGDLGLASLLGSEGTVSGHLLAPSIYNGAKGAVSRVVASPPVQAWGKNQAWRPEGYTSAPNRETLLRLLMAPQTGPSNGQ